MTLTTESPNLQKQKEEATAAAHPAPAIDVGGRRRAKVRHTRGRIGGRRSFARLRPGRRPGGGGAVSALDDTCQRTAAALSHDPGYDASPPRFLPRPLPLILARISTTDRLTCRRRSLLARFLCLSVAFILLSLSLRASSLRRWPVRTQCHQPTARGKACAHTPRRLETKQKGRGERNSPRPSPRRSVLRRQGGCRQCLLRLLGNQRLGGQQHTRDGGGVLECEARHFHRIHDPGLTTMWSPSGFSIPSPPSPDCHA